MCPERSYLENLPKELLTQVISNVFMSHPSSLTCLYLSNSYMARHLEDCSYDMSIRKLADHNHSAEQVDSLGPSIAAFLRALNGSSLNGVQPKIRLMKIWSYWLFE